MEGFIAEVMVAFVFFAVLLPLVGLLIGWFCYYVLPYLFGGVAVLVISLFVGGELVVNVWAGLFALVWAISVHFVRSKLRAHGHDVEHHHAANYMLLAGIPFHRKINRLQESPA